MKYKVGFSIIALFGCAIGVAYFAFKENYFYSFFLLLIAIYFLFQIITQQKRIIQQIYEFAEAVKYRDFTRRHPVKNKKGIEAVLYHSFNEINQVYKTIRTEQEVQNQYLSKVINMLDSAIIFYHAESGKVEWINEAFKTLFETPHLGNIHALEKRNPDLYAKTLQLHIGNQQLETAFSSKGNIKLLIQMSEFESHSSIYRIVVYQNINKAVNETENQAWHKLLRVLTHEIMNSIAPISSLAETLNERLQKLEKTEELKDIKTGISTIKSRSEGLLQFARSYRLINKVDLPKFTEISVVQLFENVYQLLEPNLIQKNIELDIILKNIRLKVIADKHLLEQVLINLILNAMEALSETSNPKIQLVGIEKDEELWIQVIDNGEGIAPELLEQVFTPFFTTKKSGNGIGLTLIKQIMLVHNGNISIRSYIGKGSEFTLEFLKR